MLENFLSSCATGGLSRRVNFHEVSFDQVKSVNVALCSARTRWTKLKFDVLVFLMNRKFNSFRCRRDDTGSSSVSSEVVAKAILD
jgi:hypothetical protein